MAKAHEIIGTRAWVEQVFASPDARQVWGRSRPTQRYAIEGSNGQPTYAEGGNEATARTLMILGQKTDQIRRYKFQPFQLTEASHGINAYPDLLFETTDGKLYVSEPRSARYLTAEKLDAAKAIEAVINASGMRYLFWTDGWPLVPACTSLAHELRKCGLADIPKGDLVALANVLSQGPKRFYELRNLGIFRDVVMSAVWHGMAHLDLFQRVTDMTLVSNNVADRQFDSILSAPVGAQSWWRNLQQ